jgi:hypothetical protein
LLGDRDERGIRKKQVKRAFTSSLVQGDDIKWMYAHVYMIVIACANRQISAWLQERFSALFDA